MHCFEETRVLPVSAESMYALVIDIESYPMFVPWVAATQILSHGEKELSAEISVDLAGLKHTFKTVDRFVDNQSIDIELMSGPFRFLESSWRFEPINAQSCRVSFAIEFEFENALLDMVASPIFGAACKTMVKTFERRAVALEGK